MGLLHYKYPHLWLVTTIMYHAVGFTKPFKRINISFHMKKNTTSGEQDKIAMPQP